MKIGLSIISKKLSTISKWFKKRFRSKEEKLYLPNNFFEVFQEKSKDPAFRMQMKSFIRTKEELESLLETDPAVRTIIKDDGEKNYAVDYALTNHPMEYYIKIIDDIKTWSYVTPK